MRLAQQNRTIAQRIKHWIDATLAAFGNSDAKERAFLYRAQTLYAKALKQKKMQAEGITANERLGYLRADFNAGLLTQEEFDNELEEILQGEDWEMVSEKEETAVTQEKAQSDTKYSLTIKRTDGTVEELADARNLTNEQAVNYLNQAKSGRLKWDAYIPVRKDTPQIIIDTLANAGESVENLSLVMQVRKAQQAMSAENRGNRSGKHGDNVRKHALTPDEVVEIVNKLDEPSMVILQTNRQTPNGEPIPNNIAVFVEYNKDGKEGVAVIEFESSINPEYIGTEYGDTNYHTVVTVFEPDVERNGMPFDYAEELLSNPDNIELEIKRSQDTGSAIGKKHPNTSSELTSSEDILRQKDVNVNRQYSFSPAQQKTRKRSMSNGVGVHK